MMGLLTWVLFHRFIPTDALTVGNGMALLLMIVFVSMLVAMISSMCDPHHSRRIQHLCGAHRIVGVSVLGFCHSTIR